MGFRGSFWVVDGWVGLGWGFEHRDSGTMIPLLFLYDSRIDIDMEYVKSLLFTTSL